MKTLALLSTKVDVRGDLVTAFVEQNLCRRLMLLFRLVLLDHMLVVSCSVMFFPTRSDKMS